MAPTRTEQPSRRERKKAETRRRLVDAALALFRERGFDGTRVEDITNAAGVAVGTFFNYFPAKEAVLQDLQRASVTESLEHARSIERGDARTRFLRQFAWLAARTDTMDGELTRVFFGRLMASPSITSPNRPFVYELFDVYEGWISEGQRRGELRADFDPRAAAVMLHELWSHSYLRWSTHPHEIDLARRMAERVELVFRGLARSE